MKAVIHTGVPAPWAEALHLPWPLVPLGNRPLLEYWLEWCVELHIREIRLVLDEGAQAIEAWAGAGDRWGVQISYSFDRNSQQPVAFLRRNPQLWTKAGLLQVCGPVFPRRLSADSLSGKPAPIQPATTRMYRNAGAVLCVLSTDIAFLNSYIQSGPAATRVSNGPDVENAGFEDVGREMVPLNTIRDVFELNMRLVQGDMEHYLRPGYYYADQVGIGYNVLTPPTATLTAPLIIGNDCRISPMTRIGPDVCIGSHVIIDRHCDISRAVILDGTYIGRGMELHGKMVAGNTVIDPHSDATVSIPDPWMVSAIQTRSRLRDFGQVLCSRLTAGIVVLTQFLPFALLVGGMITQGACFEHRQVRGRHDKPLLLPEFRPAEQASGILTSLFMALGLDRYPQFLLALSGRLWLCGHRPKAAAASVLGNGTTDDPAPFPAVISYADLREADHDTAMERAEDFYYLHHRSWREDLKMLGRFIKRRWIRLLPDRAP